MYGFTCRKFDDYHCFEHSELKIALFVYSDGSGMLRHSTDGCSVQIPTIYEINLGGFRNPQKFDNIRHDVIHVLYWYLAYGELSPNHQKLMRIADTPLFKCHWEEYKIESLELYIISGIKREYIGYYEQASTFWKWCSQQLRL